MSSEITGKVRQLVDLELDVYRATQFETVRDGEAVPLWTNRWDLATAITGVVDPDDAVFPSGRGAQLSKTSTADRALWTWDAVPDMENMSVIAYQRCVNLDTLSIFARTSGADATKTGYHFQLLTTSARFNRQNAGVQTADLATVNHTLDITQPTWMRFDVITTAGPAALLRAKFWQGALSDEPSTFQLGFDHSGAGLITGVGKAGISINNIGSLSRCGFFRVRSILGSLTETVTHTKPSAHVPMSLGIPDVANVSFTPAELSLGENLGKRAKVTIQFKDHPGADLGEFFNNGTHWGKFRGRDLFRRGNDVSIRTQLTAADNNNDAVQSETRFFVAESFDGPTLGGMFSITAMDAIQLAENDRSQCPTISNGFLGADITAVSTSFSALPTGIGAIDYSSITNVVSGYVALGGDEIVRVTRVSDTFTVVGGVAGRAQFGTVAAAHSDEDRIQLCEYVEAQTPSAIINRMFTVFAGMDSSLIPLTEWEQEEDVYLQRVYTRLIAEPLGVNKLVSELCEQAGLIVFPDNVANLIRMQVLKSIPTTSFEFNQANTIAGTMGVQEQLGKRITQVWSYYGVRNPLESLEEANNFRSTLATIDTEGQTEHGEAIIKKIYGTWIPAFGRDTAERINDLQIGRFKSPPRKFNFDVMRYSGVEEPVEGGGYRLLWWGNQDELGYAYNTPIQVISIDPLQDRLKVVAEEMLFSFESAADLLDRVITIDSNTNNLNLRQLHDSIYPALTEDDLGYNGVTVTFIISTDVIVGSTDVSIPAIVHDDTWIDTFTPRLINLGRIQGRGGRGGSFGETTMDGEDGGPALYAEHPLDVVNSAGEIWSGGGGGAAAKIEGDEPGGPCGGGGGAGQIPGDGGSGNFEGQPGAAGTTEAGGAGGDGPGEASDGGDGGGPGLPGQDTPGVSPPQGGDAGAAIDGLNWVDLIGADGDIRGGQIN